MKDFIINKTDLQIEIIRYKKFKDSITIGLVNVRKGVYLLLCDFLERYEEDGTLGDAYTTEIMFSKSDVEDTLFGVRIKGFSGLVFGSLSKRTYHATLYTNKAYSHLTDQLDQIKG
jgi:hypothetical protein